MKLWKDAWWLTKKELPRQVRGFIISGCVSLYLGIITFALASEMYSSGYITSYVNGFLLDFMVLCAIGSGAVGLNKDYLSYWKSDCFSNRLAFLKGLPIHAKVIVLSRIQLLFISLLIIFPPYLIVFFLGTDAIREQYAWYDVVKLALVFVGLCLAMTGFYIYCEMTMSGKAYLRMSFIMVTCMLLFCLVGAFFQDSLVLRLIDYLNGGGAVFSLLVLAAGVGYLAFCARQVEHKLNARDFL